MNDAKLGAILLYSCILVFVYYTLWIIILPFYEPISFLFPPVRYALIVPALVGFLFCTTLVLFTVVKIDRGISVFIKNT